MSQKTTNNTPTQEVSPIAQLLPQEYITTIPKLVTAMQTSLERAKTAVANFPEVTNDQEKAAAFALREKINTVMKEYNGKRMPFTRSLDQIKTVFTTAEAGYQALLDAMDSKTKKYAQKQLDDARAAKMEAEKKLKAEQDLIDLKANIKLSLEQKVSSFLDIVRAAAGKMVADVTKENLTESQQRLSVDPKWTPKMEAAYYTVPTQWEGDQAKIDLYQEIAKAEYQRLKDHYTTRGSTLLADSKSLLEVAVKSREEAARLQESMTAAHKKEEEKAHEAIIDDATTEKTFAALDTVAPPPPPVKIKWKIEVDSNDGWLQILAFWYSNDPDAKKTDLSKTLSKFRTFAQNKFNSDGIKIEHPAVRYVEDVAAKKG